MDRRGFLGSIIALGCAPAIVRASSLMPVRVLDAPVGIWEAVLDQLHFDHLSGRTNFAALSAAQKELWSREIWRAAREQAFVSKFVCHTPPSKLLATIPYGAGAIELYSGRPPEL